MKQLLIYVLLVVVAACSGAASEDNIQIVTFDTSLRCEDCVDKMFDNLPKEEGVVDLEVGYEEKRVTIVFNAQETSVEKLADKINELGYTAYVVSLDKKTE